MDQKQITESDILAGFKKLELTARDGKPITLNAHGLPWRSALRFSTEADLFRHSEATLEGGILKEDQPQLDLLTPDGLAYVVGVISALTNGLPKLKKSQQILSQHFLNTPTSSTPNANSSSPVIPLTASAAALPPNYSGPSKGEDIAKPIATSDSSP